MVFKNVFIYSFIESQREKKTGNRFPLSDFASQMPTADRLGPSQSQQLRTVSRFAMWVNHHLLPLKMCIKQKMELEAELGLKPSYHDLREEGGPSGDLSTMIKCTPGKHIGLCFQ